MPKETSEALALASVNFSSRTLNTDNYCTRPRRPRDGLLDPTRANYQMRSPLPASRSQGKSVLGDLHLKKKNMGSFSVQCLGKQSFTIRDTVKA